LPVRDKLFIAPVLSVWLDKRKLVNLILLVFGGVGVIKGPLLERNVSTDKINQPAVLLI
jgi:hypothetical protein